MCIRNFDKETFIQESTAMIILKAIQNKELQEYTNSVYWHIGLLFLIT
jgi:hypothetical protein